MGLLRTYVGTARTHAPRNYGVFLFFFSFSVSQKNIIRTIIIVVIIIITAGFRPEYRAKKKKKARPARTSVLFPGPCRGTDTEEPVRYRGTMAGDTCDRTEKPLVCRVALVPVLDARTDRLRPDCVVPARAENPTNRTRPVIFLCVYARATNNRYYYITTSDTIHIYVYLGG